MVGDLIGMNVYSFVCVASPVLWRIVRVSIASVVILQWSAALAADTGSQNIWGKGNDFSNAQGGVSQPALPVSGKVPKTAAWKAICDAHFRDFESRNRDERERIQARFRTQVERDREWARWVADRDGQSRACAETWPGTYDLARASGNVAGLGGASGTAGGESCRSVPVAAPPACNGVVRSIVLNTPAGSRPAGTRADGTFVVGERETADLRLFDGSVLRMPSGSALDPEFCRILLAQARSEGNIGDGWITLPNQIAMQYRARIEKHIKRAAPARQTFTPCLGSRD